MGIAQALTRRTEVRIAHAARAGLEQLAACAAADGGLPLEVVLPDGDRIGFGLHARIRLLVRDPDCFFLCSAGSGGRRLSRPIGWT